MDSTIYRHIMLSTQSAECILRLCALSFSSDCISKYAQTLTIDTCRRSRPALESPIPFSDSGLALRWVTKLFPDPPLEKRTAEVLAQAEEGRRLWCRGFLHSGISALLASIMVNGTSLRHVSLHATSLGTDPTVIELVLSKIDYDIAIGAETFSKIESFSVTPSYDDGVPLLPHLQHFALYNATENVYLHIQLPKCAELGTTLRSLTFRHVNAAGDKVRAVLSLARFPFLRELSISEWSWNGQFSYPGLVSLIHHRCPSLQIFVLDFAGQPDNNSRNNRPKPRLAMLPNITHARFHIDHLADEYQDLALILQPDPSAWPWPQHVQRLEITGLTEFMLHSVTVACVMSLPIQVGLGSVRSLRLVFDLDYTQHFPLDEEIRCFVDVLTEVIEAARSKGVYVGVYLRGAGDLDSVDQLYLGYETESILKDEE